MQLKGLDRQRQQQCESIAAGHVLCHPTNSDQRCRLRDARQLRMPSEDAQRRFEAVDLGALQQEVLEVQAVCEAAASPLVCSHNDLLSGNILVPIDVRALPLLSGSLLGPARWHEGGRTMSNCSSPHIITAQHVTGYRAGSRESSLRIHVI